MEVLPWIVHQHHHTAVSATLAGRRLFSIRNKILDWGKSTNMINVRFSETLTTTLSSAQWIISFNTTWWSCSTSWMKLLSIWQYLYFCLVTSVKWQHVEHKTKQLSVTMYWSQELLLLLKEKLKEGLEEENLIQVWEKFECMWRGHVRHKRISVYKVPENRPESNSRWIFLGLLSLTELPNYAAVISQHTQFSRKRWCQFGTSLPGLAPPQNSTVWDVVK